MVQLDSVPDWLGAALIGAVLAALGFVGKTIVESVNESRATARERRAQLVELHSHLRASSITFQTQAERRDTLASMIRRNHPEFDTRASSAEGYEKLFAEAFEQFTTQERELHTIIRGMTEHAMRPANAALLEWLRQDSYYKAQRFDRGKYAALARLLPQLEAHLMLWQAKYEVWIPEHPEHALVYLADEQRHGIGFPTGIDQEVARLLGLETASK